MFIFLSIWAPFYEIAIFDDQHGGEGRLSEKFSNAMQHVVGDDVRYNLFSFTIFFLIYNTLYLLFIGLILG